MLVYFVILAVIPLASDFGVLKGFAHMETNSSFVISLVVYRMIHLIYIIESIWMC